MGATVVQVTACGNGVVVFDMSEINGLHNIGITSFGMLPEDGLPAKDIQVVGRLSC